MNHVPTGFMISAYEKESSAHEYTTDTRVCWIVNFGENQRWVTRGCDYIREERVTSTLWGFISFMCCSPISLFVSHNNTGFKLIGQAFLSILNKGSKGVIIFTFGFIAHWDKFIEIVPVEVAVEYCPEIAPCENRM